MTFLCGVRWFVFGVVFGAGCFLSYVWGWNRGIRRLRKALDGTFSRMPSKF